MMGNGQCVITNGEMGGHRTCRAGYVNHTRVCDQDAEIKVQKWNVGTFVASWFVDGQHFRVVMVCVCVFFTSTMKHISEDINMSERYLPWLVGDQFGRHRSIDRLVFPVFHTTVAVQRNVTGDDGWWCYHQAVWEATDEKCNYRPSICFVIGAAVSDGCLLVFNQVYQRCKRIFVCSYVRSLVTAVPVYRRSMKWKWNVKKAQTEGNL